MVVISNWFYFSVRKHLQPKSRASNKILANILNGLWQNQLPNFEMEQAFNIVFSQLEPRCSVCCFFSRSEASKDK